MEPELIDCDTARKQGFARLHGVCHPLLLEEALEPLPTPPTADDIFVPGIAATGGISQSTPADIAARAQRANQQARSRERSDASDAGGSDWEDDKWDADAPGAMPRPVDLRIPAGARVAAVTGPNTGGKTAALKTLGVSALMAQAGMHICLWPDPESDMTYDQLDPPQVHYLVRECMRMLFNPAIVRARPSGSGPPPVTRAASRP